MAESCDGLIAIPCAVQGRFSSFWAAVTELTLPPRVDIRTGRGCSPATNRNGLIQIAIDRGARWVWFLDDDLMFRPDALTSLLARMEATGVDALVPLSFKRQPPFEALWLSGDGDHGAMLQTLPAPSALVPLKAATFGGLLIKTDVLRRMVPPYVALGQYVPDQWDDDLYFYEKVREAGCQLWGDPSVQFGHTTDVEVWPHYDPEMGWSVVFARGTVPFLRQPWGEPVLEPVCP